MPHFSKTVSQLSRTELLSAADTFDLAATGSVTELRARVKAYINNNEHLMSNANYWHLFTRQQRNRWTARTPSPTPPPWGGIGSQTPAPSTPDSENDDTLSSHAGDNPDPPNNDTGAPSIDRDTQIQLLQSLPPASLAKAITALFNSGLHTLHYYRFFGLCPLHYYRAFVHSRAPPTPSLSGLPPTPGLRPLHYYRGFPPTPGLCPLHYYRA